MLVIGANDTVNPAAMDDPSSPIAGMPVLHGVGGEGRHRLQAVDGSRATPASQNPLFYRDNSQMLFGDAKDRVEDIVKALEGALARR